MTDRKLPRILERYEAARSRLFRVEGVALEFSNGRQVAYERLKNAGVGAVVIAPVTNDGLIVLVREYAAGVHAYELGLPKGRMERGETPEAAANRELKEEAGYGAGDLRRLKPLTLSPAYMSHRTDVVLARDLYPEKLEGDEPEEIEVVHWPLDDLAGLAARDDVTEGRTIAALYLAREFIKEQDHDR